MLMTPIPALTREIGSSTREFLAMSSHHQYSNGYLNGLRNSLSPKAAVVMWTSL